MTATQTRPPAMERPAPPDPARSGVPGDPLLDQRLARLAARSAAHRQVPAAPATSRPRHRHAAEGSRTAALALSVGTTLALAGYLYSQQTVDSTAATADTVTAATTPTTTAVDTTAGSSSATSLATHVVNPSASAAAGSATETAIAVVADSAVATTGLADGTYTGDTFTNRWGPVQVAVTVADGVITDVTAIQIPDDDRKSVSINDHAVPVLVEATLTSQSADVDTVSGATYTSDGYRQSLQTAIDQARTAAVS